MINSAAKYLCLSAAKMKPVLLIFFLLIFLLDPDNYLPVMQDATEHDEDREDSEESDENCEDYEDSDEVCEDCDCCPMCLRCCFYAGRVGCKTKYYRISCLIKDLPTVTEKPPIVDLKLDIHQISHDPCLRPSHLQPPNSAPSSASSANSKTYSENQQCQLLHNSRSQQSNNVDQQMSYDILDSYFMSHSCQHDCQHPQEPLPRRNC